MVQRYWYMVTYPNGYQAVEFHSPAEADVKARATAHPVERVVVMTPYVFNKQMRDAYNVGKYGPVEVTLDDLLEKEEL